MSITIRFDKATILSKPDTDISGFARYDYAHILPAPGSIVSIQGDPYIVLAGTGQAFDEHGKQYAYIRVWPAFNKAGK